MAKVLIFSICLAVLLPCAEPCFITDSLYVMVPQTLPAGYMVAKVGTAGCDEAPVRYTSRDPSFTVKTNGEVVASAPVSLTSGGRTFSVRSQDESGSESEMEIHLVYRAARQIKRTGPGFLRRSKRRWSPPPFNILENDRGPFPKVIEKIVSDSEAKYNVYYTLSGPGIDQEPIGVFSFNSTNGVLSVNKAVDREQYPLFILRTRVFDKYTHRETDDYLDIQIIVDDVNDNDPTFSDPLQYTVLEQSQPGTVVGTVNATDRDDQKTLHVKIRYTLLTGLDLFTINPQTGVIATVTNTLDREVKDKHLVTVQIKDMDGAVTGRATTGTATITVGDINDNPPTFTKSSYAVSVKENESEKLVLRIPVEDKDLVNSPNWISKFVITKGNENGNFRMDRDPETNEGLLYVSKPLDHERAKKIQLEIMARNEAELSGTQAQWPSIPVDVTVTNVDEGPEFTAPTVRFTVKENTPNGTLIGSYTAVDPETKSSNGIKYYKVTDPGLWINVDRNNGELRVANTIDRESQYVHDGIYNITMKAIDASSKTGTGMVIIQVEDVNDNVPVLPANELIICEKSGELGSVLVLAEDKDDTPLSHPFTFELPKESDGKWSVTRFNDTAATLRHVKDLPTGIYSVPIDVTDLQGFGKTQTVTVRICECRSGVCLAKDRSAALGGLALLAMLLPLLLLLLLCALLVFFCVTKPHKLHPDTIGDSGGMLIPSNTEGRGDEVDSSLIVVPTSGLEQIGKGSVQQVAAGGGWQGIKSSSTMGMMAAHEMNQSAANMYSSSQYGNDVQLFGDQMGCQAIGSSTSFDNRYLVQDSALLHTWQTNGIYLHQKLAYMGTEGDGRYADDIIHAYGFEGAGSSAGSVGCCSDYGDSDDLDFLNALGPKFKTLADVCTKT